MATSKHRIIGVNSDKDECSCCGKQNLSKVVWIENTESGLISHYGTTCAAYILSPKSGKKADVNHLLLQRAESWGLAIIEPIQHIPEMKERTIAYGSALINAGWDNLFPTVDSRSAIFCNYVYPYKRLTENKA